MINILVVEEINPAEIPDLQDLGFLETTALTALRLAAQAGEIPPAGNLTIVIAGDEQLHELNKQFLGIDAPTDVLSFPSDETDPETGEPYLGDVILSYARATAQAAAGGHTTRDEMQLLVVHGILHLLGQDHAEEQDRESMWALQRQILGELGCAISGPAE